MTHLALEAIIFFGFATYNLTCAFVDIPTKRTSRMMMLARKQQGTKAEKLLDVYIAKIAGLIAPYLKLDKLKRNKLQRALDIAGLELTPEAYTARAWVIAGGVGLTSILMVFIKIIGVIFLLHIFLLVFQYSIAAIFVHKNPFRLLGKMMPAYFTALGTQSSAATIPVTLEQTKKNGVSADIAGFVIPLCATIHLSGSTLKIVACALALMMMQGMPFDFPLFAGFIFMLGITMVAAPGVPGGAIMASLGILQSMLGFDESAQALMIALYIAMGASVVVA